MKTAQTVADMTVETELQAADVALDQTIGALGSATTLRPSAALRAKIMAARAAAKAAQKLLEEAIEMALEEEEEGDEDEE